MPIPWIDRFDPESYADRQLSLLSQGPPGPSPHPVHREPGPDGLLPPPQPAGSDVGRPFARVLADVTRGRGATGLTYIQQT